MTAFEKRVRRAFDGVLACLLQHAKKCPAHEILTTIVERACKDELEDIYGFLREMDEALWVLDARKGCQCPEFATSLHENGYPTGIGDGCVALIDAMQGHYGDINTKDVIRGLGVEQKVEDALILLFGENV